MIASEKQLKNRFKKGGIPWNYGVTLKSNFAEHRELRFAIDNGITLSDKSHKEFHKKYGFKKNTRGQLEEFINNKTQ